MSGINIDATCKRRIQPRQYCRNGLVVPAQFQQEVAQSLNQLARYRTKEYFRASGDVIGPVENKLWRFAGHIGPMARAVVARILMAPATQSTQTNNPRVQMALYNTGGAQIGQGTAYFGYRFGDSPAETPEEWGVATIGIDVSAYRDTSFRAQLIASDEARPISCTVHESAQHADTNNGYVNQQFSVGAPILDVDRSSLQTLAHALYKRACGPVFTFSSNTDATAPNWEGDFTGGPVNWIDGFGLGLGRGPDRPAFTVDLSYCNRKTVATVPVKFETYAAYAGGSGMIRVVDDSGNNYAEWNFTGAAAWLSPITANLPADRRRYLIEMQGAGGNRVFLYALTCYRYQ